MPCIWPSGSQCAFAHFGACLHCLLTWMFTFCFAVCRCPPPPQELSRLAERNMSSGAKSEKQERERRLAAELAAKLVGGLAGGTLWCMLRTAGCACRS